MAKKMQGFAWVLDEVKFLTFYELIKFKRVVDERKEKVKKRKKNTFVITHELLHTVAATN